ncbi:uncharacterized protein LY89DRAFT_80342 [Mollisia scopiformis]|uniref:Uncharacterized protein n=1 Tax=Mollisia scopiformis TaxID=149040 RepID=A0A194X850_MOLSC|nr:uncharacterized protein LY89DRAFT_80342 [Mollisia scopiformis]KUJ16345.1 hypothetical protein LY89DRAFT_80342 [Mollisia scopiformis]
MPPPPLALSPALPSELLTYVLTHQIYPTTLLICQPRNVFLTSLLSSIPQPIQRQPPPPETHLPDPEDEDPPPRHPLLIPTLHQIATSRSVNVVFIPTVSHLRAYLSVFPPPTENASPPEPKLDKPGKEVPLLVVYGLVDLHRDTSEWSAQGFGNSVASLVEAGRRGDRKIVVIEEKKEEDSSYVVEGEEVERKPGWKVWDERVPMLNGNIRRAGFESEESAWSGRTIEIGRIYARWFRFGRGDWDLEE